MPPIGALGERVRDTGAGWIASEWEDDDALLDRIMAILAPESADEFEQAAHRARSVLHQTQEQMALATDAVYATAKQPLAQPDMASLPKR